MDKQDLKRKLEGLQEMQMHEIFKILLHHGEKYTINSNGVFVNISLLNHDTLIAIEKYIDFCVKSDIYLDEHEKKMKSGLYTKLIT